MESNIDTLINFSYKNGKYQKLLLFFCFVTWLNSNLFNTSMSLFSQESLIQNPNNKSEAISLNKTICQKHSNNSSYPLPINTTYPYSIISSTSSECLILGKVLYEASPHIGNILGGFLYVYFSNNKTYKSLIFSASSILILCYVLISFQKNIGIIALVLLFSTIQTNSILCSIFILSLELEKGKDRAKKQNLSI